MLWIIWRKKAAAQPILGQKVVATHGDVHHHHQAAQLFRTFCVEVRGGPDHVMEVRSERWSQTCVVLQIDKVYQSQSDRLLEKVYTKNIPWPKHPEQLVTCLT